jgi:hypothetical protein
MRWRYREWRHRHRKRIVQAFCLSCMVGTGILAALMFMTRFSLPFLTVEQTIAVASVVTTILFWILVLPIATSLEIGPLHFLTELYSKDEPIGEKESYRGNLLLKFGSARETCSSLASLATGIIGIIIAVSAIAGVAGLGSQILLVATTFLLIVSTLLLMHGVDIYDSALNPGIPIRFLENIRRGGVFYYSWGLFCLVISMILGVSLIHPYLTLLASIAYMIAASRYLFIWELTE